MASYKEMIEQANKLLADAEVLRKSEMKEVIANFFNYCAELYQYTMQTMVAHDAKQALLLVCISVLLAFFFKPGKISFLY